MTAILRRCWMSRTGRCLLLVCVLKVFQKFNSLRKGAEEPATEDEEDEFLLHWSDSSEDNTDPSHNIIVTSPQTLSSTENIDSANQTQAVEEPPIKQMKFPEKFYPNKYRSDLFENNEDRIAIKIIIKENEKFFMTQVPPKTEIIHD